MQCDAVFAKTFVMSGNELVVETCFILHKVNPFCIIFKLHADFIPYALGLSE